MVGLKPQVIKPEILEKIKDGESYIDYTLRNAQEKIQAVQHKMKHNVDHPILAADTIVMIEDQLLEKPHDKAHAIQMLEKLSGRWHEVYTGFALKTKDNEEVYAEVVKTKVLFRDLSREEITKYVESGAPMDKAGSYGIQDDYGAGFVLRIEGSYTNVVGLPLAEVLSKLGLQH